MVRVNGVEMPLAERSGVLVLEDSSGHQSWVLIVDATVEYGDAEFTGGDLPQMKVIAEMKPGEMLRVANTIEAGEENVLVYSRLLVALLREERDRYAELEKAHDQQRRLKQRAEAARTDAEREHAEEVHRAWASGAKNGYGAAFGELSLDGVLAQNPHPEPEDDETDGCHVCGGPDH